MNAATVHERAVIGCAMSRPDLIPDAGVEPGDFSNPSCRRAWSALLELHRASEPIGLASVEAHARSVDVAVLAEECRDEVGSGEAIAYHGRAVRRWAIDGQVRQILERAIKDRGAIGDEIIGNVQGEFARIDLPREHAGRLLSKGLGETFNELEARYRGGGGTPGLPTGLHELDRVLGGLQRGVVSVVAGRPSAGKSALCATIARLAAGRGDDVDYYSVEDTEASLHYRLLAQQSRVNLERLASAALDPKDWAAVQTAAGELHTIGKRIYVCDELPRSVGRLLTAIERNAIRKKTKLIVVDYFQLLRDEKRPRGWSRAEELAMISGHLCALARRLGVPVLLAAQLNRGAEEGRPQLHHLKDCGSLEQD
jgi:replicative DNA helicase